MADYSNEYLSFIPDYNNPFQTGTTNPFEFTQNIETAGNIINLENNIPSMNLSVNTESNISPPFYKDILVLHGAEIAALQQSGGGGGGGGGNTSSSSVLLNTIPYFTQTNPPNLTSSQIYSNTFSGPVTDPSMLSFGNNNLAQSPSINSTRLLIPNPSGNIQINTTTGFVVNNGAQVPFTVDTTGTLIIPNNNVIASNIVNNSAAGTPLFTVANSVLTLNNNGLVYTNIPDTTLAQNATGTASIRAGLIKGFLVQDVSLVLSKLSVAATPATTFADFGYLNVNFPNSTPAQSAGNFNLCPVLYNNSVGTNNKPVGTVNNLYYNSSATENSTFVLYNGLPGNFCIDTLNENSINGTSITTANAVQHKMYKDKLGKSYTLRLQADSPADSGLANVVTTFGINPPLITDTPRYSDTPVANFKAVSDYVIANSLPIYSIPLNTLNTDSALQIEYRGSCYTQSPIPCIGLTNTGVGSYSTYLDPAFPYLNKPATTLNTQTNCATFTGSCILYKSGTTYRLGYNGAYFDVSGATVVFRINGNALEVCVFGPCLSPYVPSDADLSAIGAIANGNPIPPTGDATNTVTQYCRNGNVLAAHWDVIIDVINN